MHVELEVSPHPWRCIAEDGTRCQWLRVRRLGSVWCCGLFSEPDDRGRLAALSEREGCLEKHPKCVRLGKESAP